MAASVAAQSPTFLPRSSGGDVGTSLWLVRGVSSAGERGYVPPVLILMQEEGQRPRGREGAPPFPARRRKQGKRAMWRSPPGFSAAVVASVAAQPPTFLQRGSGGDGVAGTSLRLVSGVFSVGEQGSVPLALLRRRPGVGGKAVVPSLCTHAMERPNSIDYQPVFVPLAPALP